MKTKELKKIAKENDYKLENKHNQLEHKLEFRRFVNHIAIREGIENRIFFNINYCNEKDLNMIKASIEYAETPPKDREEEKFNLKHKWIAKARDYKTGFLNYDPCNDILFIHSEYQTHLTTTQFTLKEIEEIKEKFDTDLADFELVEVKDEE